MSSAALFFLITLASTVIVSGSASFLICISCPCGSGNQNYTHCVNDSLLKDFSCDRWSHCKTCKANTTFCITCPKDRYGPTCSQTGDIRKKRDVSYILNHLRYRRQAVSGRFSETYCENPGTISGGRVIVILPLESSRQPSDEYDDYELPYGTRLKYVCDEGFSLVGKDVLRCRSDSFWNEPVPKCVGEAPTPEETCKHPGVDVNGRISNPPVNPRRRQVFPVGIQVTFSCNDGFQPEGETIIVCLRNGKWTALPPKCLSSSNSEEFKDLPCRHPGMVINGMFDGDLYKSSFPVGTVLRFSCIEGHQRKGPLTIHCLRNGRWSDSPPICEQRRNNKR